MSSEYSSSSFYESSFGGATNGYGIPYGGSSPRKSHSNYKSTSTTGYGVRTGEALLGGTSSEYNLSSSSYGGFDQQGLSGTSSVNGNGYSTSNFEQQSSTLTTNYPTDAQGFYRDPNPQFVRRPALGGTQTYTQRVVVKFLQPPPVPPPGPLIIKEVRPPQPPPPPPLYIRQRPPPPPTKPPIFIREAPPKMPPAVGTQVITKMLPPLPVPPRSVIIERLPPLPPKPRDVIVERWLPYQAQQKRRVIIQRAPPAVVQKPRNIIIYYEPSNAQIVRRFQNLGIQPANPTEYVARYGTQLEDAQKLVTRARQAGVVEDISPPGGTASSFQSPNYESYQSNGPIENAGGISSSSYESSSSYGNIGGIGSLDSSFDGFNLVNNTNGLLGKNSSYGSYSSQQTYS